MGHGTRRRRHASCYAERVGALEETLPFAGVGEAPNAGTIGRFVVLDLLGQGAMGIVIGAYDPELDRKVAIKLLRPGAYGAVDSAGAGRERLQREARAMAKLSHPNVLAIHEVGEIDGQLFLATELAPGGTLQQWQLAEPRGWRDVLARYVQAGRGLAAAHAVGLVHRDFKPANVLLDKDGNARVADFGLVAVDRAVTPEEPAAASIDPALTQSGALVGTPAYMAPEQVSRGAVGPAADQFSFCVALWGALHGAAPFAGSIASTIVENVRANRIVEPRDSDVPEWLRAVLRRGLAFDPAERWPSMDALLSELTRDPAAERARRLAIGATIGTVVVLIGAIGYLATRSDESRCEDMGRTLAGVWDADRMASVRAAFARSGRSDAADVFERFAKQLDVYTSRWIDARRAACEATHVHGDQSTELLDLKVACLDRRVVALSALVDVYREPPTGEMLDRAVPATFALAPLEPCADVDALRAAFPPPSDPATRAKITTARQQLAAAKALGESGQYPRARTAGQQALAVAEATEHPPVIAEALHRQGTLEGLAGDGKAARALFERALLAAATAHDDILVAQVWTELIYVVGQLLARPADGLAMKTAALTALRRADNDPVTEGNLISNLGRVLIADSKWAEAQQQLERALAIKERTSGPDSPDVGRLLLSLGIAYDQQGDSERSLAVYGRARKIFETAYGPRHPLVAAAIANRAAVLAETDRLDEAIAGHQQVLAILIETVGPKHRNVADTHQNLGQTYRTMGKPDLAREHVEKAIAIQREILGEDHPDLAQNITNLGIFEMDADHYEPARAHFVRALEIYKAAGMGDGTEALYALTGLESAYYYLKRYADALAISERILKLREAEGGLDVNVAHAQLAVGRNLLALGRDRARALDLMAKARATYQAEAGPLLESRLKELDDALRTHGR